ncbi:MAG: DUF4115 domain-containing protein [Calditerrivibrio sp.]|nr:DUF4115 domain-containing protein [Calditerrivibrio sp.]
MSRLGEILRAKREELGIELQKAAKDLRISITYLEAIEKGGYLLLPSYVHCYGFTKSYIRYLGLSEQEMMELFHLECKKSMFQPGTTQGDEEVYKEVNKEVDKDQLKKRIYLYLGISILFLLVASAYFFVVKKPETDDNSVTINITKDIDNRVLDNRSDNKTSVSDNSVMDNSNVLAQLESIDLSKDNKSDNKVLAKTIKLTFYNICWVNVRIDNQTELDFIAKPGYVKEFSFKEFFIINIGDASAIAINYEGQTIAGLGKPKESVKNLYFTVNNGKLTYTKK